MDVANMWTPLRLSVTRRILSALLIGSLAGVGSAAAASGKATAKLEPKSGSKVVGTIHFEETAAGLKVTYDVSGLNKNAKHGLHVHEKGDCSGKDGKTAGTHFAEIAPTGGTSIDTPAKYAGDLPQIETNAKGVAKGSFEVASVSLNKEHAITGLAIIVHGGPDDPTKKSAHRVACGVIQEVQQ